MSKGRASLGRFAGPRIVQPVLKNKVNTLKLSSVQLPVEENNSMAEIELEPSNTNQIIKTHHPIQTPRSELNENRPLLHSVSSMIFDFDDLLIFDPEPKIMETQLEEVNSIFSSKCKQCQKVCDFTDPEIQIEEKKAKEEVLNDILNAVSDQRIVGVLTQDEYFDLYLAFRRNVIRTTPPPPEVWFAPVSIDFNLDRVEEVGWSHLSLFYDILIAFLSNRKFNTTFCPEETKKLLKGVISMFQSPDNREREKLMKLFHGIYKNMKKLRPFSRKCIVQFLSAVSNSPYPRLGVSEILNAIVPIIAGFKMPLHPENIDLFDKVILPLHSCSYVHFFHLALITSLSQFLQKDRHLVSRIFEMILDHWPVTNPTKQILFLNEIEFFSEILPESSVNIIKKLCKIIAGCITGHNFTVAERALMLWESDSFMNLVKRLSKITFPLLIPEIYKTATTHWCPDVRNLALTSMRILKGCDVETFDTIGNNFKRVESEKIMSEVQRGQFWHTLIDKNPDIEEDTKSNKRTALSKLFIGCEQNMNGTVSETSSTDTNNSQPSSQGISRLPVNSTHNYHSKTSMSPKNNNTFNLQSLMSPKPPPPKGSNPRKK